MERTIAKARVYPRRAAGGHCDHRRARGPAAAGHSGGPRSSPSQLVPEQHEADRPGDCTTTRAPRGTSRWRRRRRGCRRDGEDRRGEQPCCTADDRTNGDGYSWLVQILPFMEQNTLYKRIYNAPGHAAGRPNKLLAGPFNPDGQPWTRRRRPRRRDAGLAARRSRRSSARASRAPTSRRMSVGRHSRMAAGNYVALAATHYNLDGGGTGDRTPADADSATDGVAVRQQAERGDVQAVGRQRRAFRSGSTRRADRPATDLTNYTKVRGVTQAGIQNGDGTSNTVWFTESRDENWTGWVSGYTSYVVGADPNGPGHRRFRRSTRPRHDDDPRRA